ncbi:MAG: DUF3168 domain-containing protein [Chitinispirillales bacterium]|jgi:hypothetical protein|nr:DUF3168 domain-containing protein [Chitinispirillales bacterium]
MIERLIIDALLLDDEINEYVNGNIFLLSAPESTPTPYICITADGRADDLVVDTFDIVISIYDSDEDKSITREISEKIRTLLNYIMLNGDNHSGVRLFFRGRTLNRMPESTLSQIIMTFDGRGFDENSVNHLINS